MNSEGYLILGNLQTCANATSDLLLFQTDYFGELQWLNTYGNTNSEYGIALVRRQAGYLVLGGTDQGQDSEDPAIIYVRLNMEGEVE